MRDHRWPRVLIAVVTLVTVLGVAGCSSGDGSDDSVTGVVTQVTGDLGSVESFVITDSAGKSYQFTPADGLTFHGGPIDHLREHIVSGEPVAVSYEEADDGSLIAVVVGDAD
jgi:hypothetical protein